VIASVQPARVSLLIPAYNAASFLPRLAQSVTSMHGSFARIICYDDGSDDETARVSESLGFDTIVATENRGAIYARNRLAEESNTEFIHFHDADDLIHEDFLTFVEPKLVDTADVVSCDGDWLDDGSRTVCLRWRFSERDMACNSLRTLLRTPLGLNQSTIRRSTFFDVGGFNADLPIWEDADLHIRIAASGGRFSHVERVLTYSLRRPDTFSHDYRRSAICRFGYLQRYLAADWASCVADVLAEQLETVALNLLAYREWARAREALRLARRNGRRAPVSRNPVVKLLRDAGLPTVAGYLVSRARIGSPPRMAARNVAGG
jgi:glycosyltransferase involved in cell wall biosynthesis